MSSKNVLSEKCLAFCCQLNSFCGLPIRISVKLIGFIVSLISAIGFIVEIVDLTSEEQVFGKIVMHSVLMISEIIIFFTSILMTFGICVSKKTFILPWIAVVIVIIFTAILTTIVTTITYSAWMSLLLIPDGFSLYCWLVVVSYYFILRTSDSNSRDETDDHASIKINQESVLEPDARSIIEEIEPTIE